MRPVAILLVIASAVTASFAQSEDPFGRSKAGSETGGIAHEGLAQAGAQGRRGAETRDRHRTPTLLVGDQSFKVTDATRLVTIHLGLAPGGVTMLEFRATIRSTPCIPATRRS